MKVVRVCDHLFETGKPKHLLCPHCKSKKLHAVTVTHLRRVYVVKMICANPRCRRKGKPVYDVSGGFVAVVAR